MKKVLRRDRVCAASLEHAIHGDLDDPLCVDDAQFQSRKVIRLTQGYGVSLKSRWPRGNHSPVRRVGRRLNAHHGKSQNGSNHNRYNQSRCSQWCPSSHTHSFIVARALVSVPSPVTLTTA